MRVFNSDKFGTHNNYSFSVPLYSQNNSVNKKRLAQEIWKENSKRLAKGKKPKPLRTVLPPVEKPPKISDIFLSELKKAKIKQQKKRYWETVEKPVRRYFKLEKKRQKRLEDMSHAEYKFMNMYRYNAFRKHILMRSAEGMTVEEAWILLKKCWIGFKESHKVQNMRGMRYYGRGISKYTYLLEEVQPDFSNIGLKPYKDIF